MSSTPSPTTPPDAVAADADREYQANLRRATLSSSVGSALEYFDFAMYGLMTAQIGRASCRERV